MSSDTVVDGWTDQPLPMDFTTPIARPGEQQFACILRNRSGFSAGEIDYGARIVTGLCAADQQDIVDVAYGLYQLYCNQTGKRARNDRRSE